MNVNLFQTGQQSRAIDTLFIVHWRTPTGFKGQANPCSLGVINALFGRVDLQPDSVWYDASNTKHWIVLDLRK